MAVLAQFDETGASRVVWRGAEAVAAALAPFGLGFGRWPERTRGADPDPFVAYADEIAALKARYGIQSMDRIALKPGDARWPQLREQFIAEHTHADFEIRYFVAGRGLFHVRTPGGGVFGLLCEPNEWVSLPAGTVHGYDGGEQVDFEALRFFARPDGWVAAPTGAPRPALPLFDEFVARFGQASTTPASA